MARTKTGTSKTRAAAPRKPRSSGEQRFLNRELSWLDFNERVLEMAADPLVPLLERVRFCSIFSSNLDEFFMVRVATLRESAGLMARSPDGRTPVQTLDEIHARVCELLERQIKVWNCELHPALESAGILINSMRGCLPEEIEQLTRTFEREIYPILTPLAVGPGQPFPYISGLSLSLGVLVKDPASGEQRFARVKIPEGLPRFLPAGTRGVAVPIEDVIAWFLGRLFPEMEIVETAVFRVTRDADFEVSDEADDLLEAVRGELRRRRFGEVVRLEVSGEMSESMLDQIQAGVGAADSLVYTIDGRLDLADLSQLASFERPEHRYGPWIAPPQARLSGAAESGIFSEIRRGDVAIHLPYEPFTSTVEAFVKQASKDVHSIALKATVYRTSDESPLVPALIEAAEDGKQSVCLVELKAQFDEHRNITWSRRLDQAGVHVVYGFPHLKIHAKAVLVVRREGGHLRRYVHIGTGNYNSDTARLYEDLGLLTDDEDITADIADLFNYVTGFGSPRSFRKILVAPFGLRNRLIEEIRAAAGGGKKGRIFLKVNGLTDPAIIEELYRASAAGTRVQIVARSICTLKPKVPGLSDNIEVYSILGRFLEHSRLFIFDSGKKSTFFMGSADLMPRNLDQRIEVVVPVEDPKVQQDLEAFSEMWLSDRAHCWELGPTGTWKRLAPAKDQHGISSQELMMRRARTRAARRSPAKRRRLTPRPPAR